jgi:hypothetical protein
MRAAQLDNASAGADATRVEAARTMLADAARLARPRGASRAMHPRDGKKFFLWRRRKLLKKSAAEGRGGC